MNIRKYLKALSSIELRQLFDKTELDENEKWILIYVFIQKRMVENICSKLSIGKTKYNIMLNIALIKIYFTIKQLDKVRIFD